VCECMGVICEVTGSACLKTGTNQILLLPSNIEKEHRVPNNPDTLMNLATHDYLYSETVTTHHGGR
jgi:hypothetical protein